MKPSHICEYLEIAETALQVAKSDLSPEMKYDIIFSPRVSGRLHSIMPLNYYDPDTSYEDDVEAYISALKDRCAELRKL